MTPLKAQQIFDLVSGNTMSLTAYDFTGKLYFSQNGRISAIDNNNQQDTGFWDIKDDNSLCLKFNEWYYGDAKCYSIAGSNEEKNYSFFTSNGSAYYRGNAYSGDTAGLGKAIKEKKSSRFLRTRFSSEKVDPASKPSSAEGKDTSEEATASPNDNSTTTVQQLADNCPGCNLAGADLKEARLVHANLEGADLSRADLRYANLRRANLANANLTGARLNRANLPGADLRNSNLRNADLSGSNLLLADFTGADLTGAILTNAYTEKAKGLEK